MKMSIMKEDVMSAESRNHSVNVAANAIGTRVNAVMNAGMQIAAAAANAIGTRVNAAMNADMQIAAVAANAIGTRVNAVMNADMQTAAAVIDAEIIRVLLTDKQEKIKNVIKSTSKLKRCALL